MKKTVSVFLIFIITFCFAGCDENKNNIDDSSMFENSYTSIDGNATKTDNSSSPKNNNQSSDAISQENENHLTNENKISKQAKPESTENRTTHTHDYFDATCTCPKMCSCGATAGTALGHQFSSATCTSPKICSRCGTTSGNVLGHSYSSANCNSPKTCTRCGQTEGSELGHSYSDKYCSRCGTRNPNYKEPEWYLELPSYPQNISFYSKNGQILSTVRVTNITFITDNMYGERVIMAYFYGEKIYDYKGSGQYTECKIHYKLYGPDGSAVTLQPCVSYLPSMAVGDTFSKSETVLYAKETNLTKGTYRLEIMDAYY